ncbi:glycoside hydrolase family 16 protein [uncultured Fibrobacter sp.]|uniref:glycoside hydrolase family 16 protein n=1 Tax=uncultured Fibrobacter sp. TaxID=261512 RepID=UPI0025E72E35|nr:glycoside hydrolase family 16 protein [uncultured Fibrobacter sp.]
MRNKKALHTSPYFMAKLATAFAVAGILAACSDDSSSGPETQPDSSATSDGSVTSTDSVTSASSVTLSSSSGKVGEPAEPTQASSSSVTSADSVTSASSVTLSSCSVTLPESSSGESPYLWSDEFDGSAIDTSKWTFEIGTGSSGWGNNEKEYYTGRKENAYVQDGILHIRANKENFESSGYTSARMITKRKFTFTYGTVEARIALPVGKGIWPAFWMLGENIDKVSWPACGEIDIIESINDESIVYGTHHWQYEGQHASYGNNTSDFHGAKKEVDITQFHTYKLTWDKKLIAMYVDEFKYHEMSIEDNAGGTEAFHKPFFLLLNVAVGGNWPGFEIDDSQFPNEMLVDYIRISK